MLVARSRLWVVRGKVAQSAEVFMGAIRATVKSGHSSFKNGEPWRAQSSSFSGRSLPSSLTTQHQRAFPKVSSDKEIDSNHFLTPVYITDGRQL
jgi:hypothetical protein